MSPFYSAATSWAALASAAGVSGLSDRDRGVSRWACSRGTCRSPRRSLGEPGSGVEGAKWLLPVIRCTQEAATGRRSLCSARDRCVEHHLPDVVYIARPRTRLVLEPSARSVTLKWQKNYCDEASGRW